MATKTGFHIIFRLLLSLLIAGAAIFLLLLFFFRGPFLANPLGLFLSDKVGSRVTIERVEYNILYPGIIALHNVKVHNDLNIDTVYLELDLWSYITNQKLEILELDVINPELKNSEFFNKLTSILPTNFGNIKKLWLKNLRLKDFSGITLKTTQWTPSKSIAENLFTTTSSISFNNAQTPWGQVEHGGIELNCRLNTCKADVNLSPNGGSINTIAYINPIEHTIDLNNTLISNLVVQPNNIHIPDWKINVGEIQAQNIDLEIPAASYQIGGEIDGYSGSLFASNSELHIDGEYTNFSFLGTSLQNGKISIEQDGSFNIKGFYGEHGQVNLIGTLIKEGELINLKEVMLNQISVTLAKQNLQAFLFTPYQRLKIESLTCQKCEIISDFADFSFFTRQSDISLTNLTYTKENDDFSTINCLVIGDSLQISHLEISHGDLGLFNQRFWQPQLVGSVSSEELSFSLNYNNDASLNIKARIHEDAKNSEDTLSNSICPLYDISLEGLNFNPSRFIIPNFPKIYGGVDFNFQGSTDQLNFSQTSQNLNGTINLNGSNLAIDGFNFKKRLKTFLNIASTSRLPELTTYNNDEVDELQNFVLHTQVKNSIIESAELSTTSLEGKFSAILSRAQNPLTTEISIIYKDQIEEQPQSYLVTINHDNNKVYNSTQTTQNMVIPTTTKPLGNQHNNQINDNSALDSIPDRLPAPNTNDSNINSEPPANQSVNY